MSDYTQYYENLDFDSLIVEADMLGVSHDQESWLDDEWPEAEDALRVRVINAYHEKLKENDNG